MIDRRTLIGISASIPFSGFRPRLDLPDLRIDNLELENGVHILGISPDASTLVGTVDDGQVCFLEAESLAEVSRGDLPVRVTSRDWMSLRWSPDGSQVLFGTVPQAGAGQSGIYTIEVETATVTELPVMAGESQATPVSDRLTVIFDFSPEWLDDESIVFGRHIWDGNNDSMVFMSMNLADTEPSVWHELEGLDVRMLASATRMLTDGRLVFVANPVDASYLADPADTAFRLFTVAAGQEPKRIETGDLQMFEIVDADETHVLLHDMQMFATWRFAWDDPSVEDDVAVLFDDGQDRSANLWAAIGPEPGSLVTSMNDRNRTVVVLIEDRLREIAYLRGPEATRIEYRWVENRVLVTSNEASWLIEPDL